MSEQIAQRNWKTWARIRIREDVTSRSVDPSGVRHFHAGEETVMVQWGYRGALVDRDCWWDSMDVDGAHIIPADKVEVIAVLDEVRPTDDAPTTEQEATPIAPAFRDTAPFTDEDAAEMQAVIEQHKARPTRQPRPVADAPTTEQEASHE